MRALLLSLLLSLPLSAAAEADAPAARIDGHSAEAFAASVAAIEQGMGDAERLGFRMKLAQIRAAMASQRGHHLPDAEFALALDGKSRDDLQALAADAPQKITIDIETSDDT